MPKYFAFLRAINVGGHTVKMGHLKGLFEAMGYSNVETFIASGNVIFDSTARNSKALEAKIEDYLQQVLGYKVGTFIRSPAELSSIAQYKPFDDSELNAEGNTLYVALVADSPGEESKKKLLTLASDVDDFKVYGREVYWLCRKKMGDSRFSGAVLEKILGMPATFRNSNTMKRMAAKYC